MVETITELYNERQTREYLADFHDSYIVSMPMRYFIRMDELHTFLSFHEDMYKDYVKFGLTESCFQTLLEAGAFPTGMEGLYAKCSTQDEKLNLLKKAYSNGCNFHVSLTDDNVPSHKTVIVLDPKNQIESYTLFCNLWSLKPDLIMAVEFYAGQYTTTVHLLPYGTFKIYLRGTDTDSVYENIAALSPQTTGQLPPFCLRKEFGGNFIAGEYTEPSQIDFSDGTTLAMSSFIGGTRFLEVNPGRFISMDGMRKKYPPENETESKQKFVDDCFRSVSERLARFV